MGKTQKFFVIEPTQRGWRISKLNIPFSWNFLLHRDVGVTQREVIFCENVDPALNCCESKHIFTEQCMFAKLLIRIFPGELHAGRDVTLPDCEL